MTTFVDWLPYYNDLDVDPFLEALTKMRNFYDRYVVDILKDVVSFSFVSLQFLLLDTNKHHKEPNLVAPKREDYDMRKFQS